MNFKYFSKTLSSRREAVKKSEERSAQIFMNQQFAKLMDKQLTLPISQYHL